jgi:hypothetical protein
MLANCLKFLPLFFFQRKFPLLCDYLGEYLDPPTMNLFRCLLNQTAVTSPELASLIKLLQPETTGI